MPFRGSGYAFDQATIATVYEVGAVYGLFKPQRERDGLIAFT